jgi:hypothetical protein
VAFFVAGVPTSCTCAFDGVLILGGRNGKAEIPLRVSKRVFG